MQADGPYRLVPKRIRFELPMLKQIMAQGIPSGVQNSIIAIANVVVQSNINTFGSDAMAGCGSYAQGGGLRVPAHHLLCHGTDHLYGAESGRRAV